MYQQLDIFDLTLPKFQIDKPIRLIELFAGVGSQVVEFDSFAMKSYNAIHGTDFRTTDIRNVKGGDLGITDKDRYTYILTYSFP